MTDPFEHFVAAQALVYDEVIRELAQGEKQSHWIRFIFPQLAGLGRSVMAERYALLSAAEAAHYAAHLLLGRRLRECTRLVLRTQGRTVHDIFGYPDDLKFHSSMTLFAEAVPEEPLFRQALEKYFGGAKDVNTLALLR